MRRLAFNVLSICVITMLSGCCLPNLFFPCGGGFGCPNGQCGVRQGFPAGPTGWNTSPEMIQANYPGAPMIQQGPVAFQQAPFAYQPAPTMALESLPTYR